MAARAYQGGPEDPVFRVTAAYEKVPISGRQGCLPDRASLGRYDRAPLRQTEKREGVCASKRAYLNLMNTKFQSPRST